MGYWHGYLSGARCRLAYGPLTVSCFTKIQTGFTFLVPAHPGSPGKRAVKRVCVCVCVNSSTSHRRKNTLPHTEFTFSKKVFLTMSVILHLSVYLSRRVCGLISIMQHSRLTLIGCSIRSELQQLLLLLLFPLNGLISRTT